MTKKILLIEDTADILENFTEYLELHGYQVYGATNGKRGVALATEIQPDLIICDALMANMDGFAVLEAVKHAASTSKIPFVFSTSLSEKIEKSEALALALTTISSNHSTCTNWWRWRKNGLYSPPTQNL